MSQQDAAVIVAGAVLGMFLVCCALLFVIVKLISEGC